MRIEFNGGFVILNRFSKRFSYLCWLAIAFGALALAQNDRGILTGTVQDPGHAMVPEASITVKNTATGALYETKSTTTGSYTIPSLPPGIYELTVTAPGFAKYIGENTQIHVAEVVNVNIVLTLGAVTETVTVDATAPLLQSESNDQSFTVTTNEMTDLPLASSAGGRTPQSLMSLSPGVAGTAPGTGGRVDGMPGGTGRLMIDGQDTTNINGNSGHTGPPPQETIQEFTFLTSNYSAEYSQALGGVWVMASRTGTNSFHGSAFEYWQNDALNADRPFIYTKALVRNNDINGAVSGPVIIPKVYNGRNKTFFSVDFEGARSSLTSGYTLSNLPTVAMRGGDFSAALTGRTLSGKDPLGNAYLENTIYDPMTTATAPNGTPYRTPFPNNVIPASRLDPVALKIQSLIPVPVLGGVTNNWVVSPRFALISLQPYVKVDHYISPAMKISFFNFRPSNISPEDEDGLPLPISAVQKPNDVTWIERINYDYTITPTIVLHLGIGLFRFSNPASSPASVLNYNASGLLGFNGSAVGVGFPRINGLNSSDGGGLTPSIGPAGEDIQFYTKITAPFSLLWVRNNHQIKFGGEFHQEIFSDNEREGTSGILNFSPNETGTPSTQGQSLGGGGVGLNYASFLLGLADSATVQPPQDLEWRNRRYGLYLQDSWKITRKLTIDYGIRWDLQGQGHELYNRDSMFGPSIPNPSAGGLLGGVVYEGYGAGRCNCYFAKKYPYAVGPRLGFAYQINPKTVIRGGYGIIYASLANFNTFTASPVVGVGINQLQFPAPSFGVPGVILQNGLQYSQAALNNASLNPGILPTPGTVSSPAYFIDPNANRPGRVHSFSVNLQREVMRNLMVETAYVGNRGAWEIGATGLVNLNATNPATLLAEGYDITNPTTQKLLTSTIGSATAVAAGVKLPYPGFPTGQTVAQSLRPYPQYSSSFIPMWAPLGDSWYDSLQAKVTQRFTHGLTGQAAFTWSKEEATGQAINNVFDPPNQKSLVSSSQPFLFVVSWTYELPFDKFGPSQNKLYKQIVGGWRLGGLFRYGSGLPIPVPASQGNLNSLIFQTTRMNRVPGQPLFLQNLNCNCFDPTKTLVLNPKAWTDVPNGNWGYSAPYYNDYRYERTPYESLNLGRTFRIGEKTRLELRGEFFNVFNRLELPNPSASNPLATTTYNSSTGLLSGGFGYINVSSVGGQRSGELVARVSF